MFGLAGTVSTLLQFHAPLVGKSLTCLGVQFVTEPKKLCGISNTCDIFRFKVLYKFVDDSSKKYRWYSILILVSNLSLILIAILKFKSNADSDIDTDTDTLISLPHHAPVCPNG